MAELFRDSVAGQFVRYLLKKRVLLYPEERPDFRLPSSYATFETASAQTIGAGSAANGTGSPHNNVDEFKTVSEVETTFPAPVDCKSNCVLSSVSMDKIATSLDLENSQTKIDSEKSILTSTELDLALKDRIPIATQTTPDDDILVDWYSIHDPENPQNWSKWKKAFVSLQIYVYTTAVYMGSAIYTSSIPDIEKLFGVSPTTASLGLSLYVLGYGVGPMFFAPLSEVPCIGRNPPYIITFVIFVILCVPTALVDNFGGLLALRFLQGFFGSPCLATSGATFSDMYSFSKLPHALLLWSACATLGPALGPIFSGFSVPAMGWRWSLWEILWLAGPILIVLLVSLPETSADTILLQRATRLRKLTGNPKLRSQSEIKQSKLTLTDVAISTLWRPYQIMLLDPAVLFTNLYTSLIYGIFYSYFEVFPIVYMSIYGFSIGEMSLFFLAIVVALLIATPIYMLYLHKVFEPEIKANGLKFPERCLRPAIFASILPPIGLFIFGWTSRASIHWIASAVGITIYIVGVFTLLQCIFIYIPVIYPEYAASLFAGNDFARSAVAAGAILFARPLYLNLGVGHGISLLAGLTVGCIGGVWALYGYGAWLRSRSRFAVS
ncbi:hypothetical protein PRK78_002031 [Emydomyces testavorans]|uniref:Major facilitator superfamily (MFS) profile domain-containing protein n=1 Tax=Emydomyces testavorans TaxID=2070801 RepID=A0AAF0DEA4_9EURO|nr:hypothetical protein PRK78_002031 [Emydomyces testavorans]